jgi:hypothetical protein
MKHQFYSTITVFVLIFISSASAQQIEPLSSPDKNIEVEFHFKEKLYYAVSYQGERVLEASPLSLTLENTVLGAVPKATKPTFKQA